MACPICEKRKPKRFCPARAESICAVCCGEEREVTIDCPADCSYLAASREYDFKRRELDPQDLPFPETRIPMSFVADHQRLIASLSYAVCSAAQENREIVDSDVLASLRTLAENYRTLASGIYFEKAPDYRPQRALYERLKHAIEDYKKAESGQLSARNIRDAEIRDSLVLLTQLGARHSNGRPKGRAYLDLLRAQFGSEQFSRSASSIVLP